MALTFEQYNETLIKVINSIILKRKNMFSFLGDFYHILMETGKHIHITASKYIIKGDCLLLHNTTDNAQDIALCLNEKKNNNTEKQYEVSIYYGKKLDICYLNEGVAYNGATVYKFDRILELPKKEFDDTLLLIKGIYEEYTGIVSQTIFKDEEEKRVKTIRDFNINIKKIGQLLDITEEEIHKRFLEP